MRIENAEYGSFIVNSSTNCVYCLKHRTENCPL